MTTPAIPATDSGPEPALTPQPLRWIGGVVRPRRLRRKGKPMRVAAWMTDSGNILGAAIVEGHGPTVLRQLLDELLLVAPADRRPDRLVVWPSVRGAFGTLAFPQASFDRDRFLKIVIEDQVSFGFIPGRLPVRRG